MTDTDNLVSGVNFAVSGWIGSGSTSLAFILSRLFSYKYLHVGGIFRYIGKELGYSEEGINRPQFDDYIEPIIGPTVDKYRDYMLLESNNLVLDSDLGTFLIGKHPKVFSIFLKSSVEERIKKVIQDERADATDVLIKRDETNRQFYLQMHGVDTHDEELIDRKFNLVIDNSHVSLAAEIMLVIASLKKEAHLKSTLNIADLEEKVTEEVKSFSSLGKNGYRELLINDNLVMRPEEMVTAIAKTFPEDLANFPENVQKIFLGQYTDGKS